MEFTNVGQFLGYYEKLRARTLRVVERIPPESLEWTYKEGKFTLGDLVRHVAATERYMFAENARLRESRYPGHGKELADGYEAVVEFLKRTHAETVEILSGLSDEDLLKKCVTPNGTPITVWKWLRAMAEHEIHHRGQIYLYLSMLGVQTPPVFGLTSEEVKERSVQPSEEDVPTFRL